MIIRSQNKRLMLNFDKVTGLRVTNNSEIVAIADTGDAYCVLGKYSTEEQAIQVLNEIQDGYTDYYVMQGNVVYNNSCYRMPSYEGGETNEKL